MNLRTKMEKLADKLNPNVLYFTENPINLDRYGDDYYGCRYFLVWQNTHAIYKAFRTQVECVEYLEDLIERKVIWTWGGGYVAILD